jgi:hypothetical protein
MRFALFQSSRILKFYLALAGRFFFLGRLWAWSGLNLTGFGCRPSILGQYVLVKQFRLFIARSFARQLSLILIEAVFEFTPKYYGCRYAN